MISPSATALIARAHGQLARGLEALQGRRFLEAEVLLRAANATVDALEALLASPPTAPMRRFVIVGKEPDDGDAA